MTDWRRITGAILVAAQIAVLSPMGIYGESRNERGHEIAESAALVIGVQGGTVRLGAVQLEIPAGALEEETEIRITRLRSSRSVPVTQNVSVQLHLTTPYIA